jgi:uracil-DNA glycosylase
LTKLYKKLERHNSFDQLIREVRSCTLCEAALPLGANPIVHLAASSKILIISQAPGTKVHHAGFPWNDPSGESLRRWLDVDVDTFYDKSLFGIMPMGFCYPGRGAGGDLPPRPECAFTWHERILSHLKQVQLTILIGQYSQKYYLGKTKKSNLTETVKSFEDFLPRFFPLVHPSPRNRIWQAKNPWFEESVVPALRTRVHQIITQ